MSAIYSIDCLSGSAHACTFANTRIPARTQRARDKSRERLKIASEKFKYAKANAFIFSPHRHHKREKKCGKEPAPGALPVEAFSALIAPACAFGLIGGERRRSRALDMVSAAHFSRALNHCPRADCYKLEESFLLIYFRDGNHLHATKNPGITLKREAEDLPFFFFLTSKAH